MRELLDHVPVARKDDPDIGQRAQRAGQGGGDGGKAAHPDEVVHFRGDEKNPQERPQTRPDAGTDR